MNILAKHISDCIIFANCKNEAYCLLFSNLIFEFKNLFL